MPDTSSGPEPETTFRDWIKYWEKDTPRDTKSFSGTLYNVSVESWCNPSHAANRSHEDSKLNDLNIARWKWLWRECKIPWELPATKSSSKRKQSSYLARHFHDSHDPQYADLSCEALAVTARTCLSFKRRPCMPRKHKIESDRKRSRTKWWYNGPPYPLASNGFALFSQTVWKAAGEKYREKPKKRVPSDNSRVKCSQHCESNPK